MFNPEHNHGGVTFYQEIMSDPSISEKVKEIVTNHQKSGWVVSFDRENGTATFRKGPDMIKILDLQTGRFTQDSTMGPMW